ncbi:MAG: putative signal transducing protein [Gemmatimonadota bacterium]
MTSNEEFVVVETFIDEVSAELARNVLEANGVRAVVLRDNAGGLLPSMAVVFPVRLLVANADQALARELLATDYDADKD